MLITRGSLSLRLLTGAALWTFGALLVAWLVLGRLFEDHLQADLARRMETLLNGLAASMSVDASGRIALDREPAGPEFRQPYSGLYWQVSTPGGEAVLRSRSLWDGELALPEDVIADGAVHRHRLMGPDGAPVLAFERSVTVVGVPGRLRLGVAENAAVSEAAVGSFRRALALSLGVLGLGLSAAAVGHVVAGLRPLERLRQGLAAVREGRSQRLEGHFPDEIQPLVDDLNGLLDHDASVVERARTQTGNLAHALKTPLAVLQNEARAMEDWGDRTAAQRIRRQTDLMQRQVDYHLARARAAAAVRVPGLHTPVGDCVEGLARVMAVVHQGRGVRLETQVRGTPLFHGERQDLDEILGNLLDNAHKWARTRVRLEAEEEGGQVSVGVDDDGPGLPENDREAVFDRGRRLDESVAGAGLGLAIVRDLAELYGGSVRLGASPLGGLRAEVLLPAVTGSPSERPGTEGAGQHR